MSITKNIMKKAIYFVANDNMKWGKGLTIDAAKAAAYETRKKGFVIWAALFEECSDADLKNLYDCITANEINGNPQFYTHNRTDGDTEMINKYLIGWLIVDDKSK